MFFRCVILCQLIFGCFYLAFNSACWGQDAVQTVTSMIRESTSLSIGKGDQLILAHYMPWYEAKPSSQHWGWHWTMNHFNPDEVVSGRRSIASRYYPSIGPYDSGDPQVIQYHLLLMKLSGIDGVIVDWYGQANYRDYPVLHRNTTRLLQGCERLKMKFAICYEDQTIPILAAAGKLSKANMVDHAVSEIEWLSKYWFKSPSYVRFGNEPLLLSFGHEGLTTEQWEECLQKLSIPLRYFSQDILRPGAYGSFNWPSPHEGLKQYDDFLRRARQWPSYIPVAFPRFEDVYDAAGVHAGFPRIPDRSGQTLRDTLSRCGDSGAAICQIATWNDWGEGTQIEPSMEHGTRDLQIIQRFLQQKYGKALGLNASDLGMPGNLLKLQRSGASTSDSIVNSVVDSFVNAIDQGKIRQAREIMRAQQAAETPSE